MRNHQRWDGYQAITDRMIAALEQGTVPWRVPWNASFGRPRSLSTGRAYEGINVFLLGMTALERGYTSPWWGTIHQINALGGHVRKGQTKRDGSGATMITLWKEYPHTETDPGTGEEVTTTRHFMRAFWVWNADQTEGLPEKFYAKADPFAEIRGAQEIADTYLAQAGAPALHHDQTGRAFYRPADDEIHLPAPDRFKTPEAYYSTLFHELGHSTGHASRLGRDGVSIDHDHPFGSPAYAAEELVAEMTAAFLGAMTGTAGNGEFGQSAAYVASWLKALRNDKHLVVHAASAAQAAVRVITGQAREPYAPLKEAA